MKAQQLTTISLVILLIGTHVTQAFKPSLLAEKEDSPIANGLEEIQSTGNNSYNKNVESIIVDLQYKKSENITGRPLYPKNAKAYLHPNAIRALKRAATKLRAHGYGITILDAWRPYTSGARLWNKAVELDLKGYYCPPNDSGHTRGIAIDVCLHDLNNPNQHLEMPSGFDDPLTTKHYHLCPEKVKRAEILRLAMNYAGFIGHRKEWWHFCLPNNYSYPIIKGSQKNLLPKMNY